MIDKENFLTSYNIEPEELKAVSYTHLDVYKRQPFPSADAYIIKCDTPDVGGETCGLKQLML